MGRFAATSAMVMGIGVLDAWYAGRMARRGFMR
jgi:hypothetical protein